MTLKMYKAADVCETTGLQPYVLRSWEKEFSGIGVQKSPDSPRLYRQSDVDQVLRIKQLVFGEGLTLAGTRRRLEETSPKAARAADAEMAEVLDALGADARARIAAVRNGLRSILDVLSKTPGSEATAALRSGNGRVNDRKGTPSSGDRRGPSRLRLPDELARQAPARLAEARSTKAAGPPERAKAKARPLATRGKSKMAAKRTASAKRGAASRKPARGSKRKRATA